MTIISGLYSAPCSKAAMPDMLVAKSWESIMIAGNDPITPLLGLATVQVPSAQLPEEKPKRAIGKADLGMSGHKERKLS